MSSTFGFQPTFSGEENYGISTPPYQIGQLVTSWPGGIIQEVHVYFGGWQAAVNANLCIWDASGNILWVGSSQSVPQGTTSVGGQAWVVDTGLSVVIPAAAGGIIIGAFRDPTGRFAFSRDGTGTHTTGSNTSAGNITGSGSGTGHLGAYVVYVQGGIEVYDDGDASNHKRPVKQYDIGDTSWHWNPVKQYDLATTSWKHRG